MTPPAPSSTLVDAVLDGVEACTLFDLSVSRMECNSICLQVDTDCINSCNDAKSYDPELDDCYISVVWLEDDVLGDLVDECYTPDIEPFECCISPAEPGNYVAYVTVVHPDNSQAVIHIIDVNFQPCTTLVVSSNTTIYPNTFPTGTRFQLLEVQSGVTLTIEEGTILSFCETGKLVIEPNGHVINKGTLTADCNNGWLGVEVEGNGTANQYPHLGVYSQGKLTCMAGSIIEHAHTAVKLYGPDKEDAGGQIYADGAIFKNNSRGIDFAPFTNFLSSSANQKQYASKVRNCQFVIDNDYIIGNNFTQHIRMEGVQGIGIYGCAFRNDRILEEAQFAKQFGIGILAINSNFNVGPTAIDSGDEPCLPPCEELNYTIFHGLGIGVSVSKIRANRPFQIYNSKFSKCFFGIANEGVSGANVLYNYFDLSATHELKNNSDENAIGVSLTAYIQNMQIQQNEFIQSTGNTNFSLGIVCNNTGEVNNEIRKNSFIGLNVANEAFAINGIESEDFYSGLTYLCNYNSGTKERDFYVVNTPFADIIQKWQCEISGPNIPLGSAGNVFANSGSAADHDFANHGDLPIWYFFHTGEQPNNTSGVIATVPASSYYCQQEFCLHPCLEETDLESTVDNYYSFIDDYNDAILLEDDTLATILRSSLDSTLSNLILYHEIDTLSFNQDSLRAWYGRTNSIAGRLLLASNFIETGDYVEAIEVVDSVLSQFSLNSFQILDLNRLKYIYNAMNSRSIYALTSTEMDSVELFSSKIGASAAVCKGILYLLDTITTPMYYIPGEISPRSQADLNPGQVIPQIRVFPNPIDHTFFVDLGQYYDQNSLCKISIFDLQGRQVYKQELRFQVDEVDLSWFTLFSSILYYRIHDKNNITIKSGILFKK